MASTVSRQPEIRFSANVQEFRQQRLLREWPIDRSLPGLRLLQRSVGLTATPRAMGTTPTALRKRADLLSIKRTAAYHALRKHVEAMSAKQDQQPDRFLDLQARRTVVVRLTGRLCAESHPEHDKMVR